MAEDMRVCTQRSDNMCACSIDEDVLRAVPTRKVLRCFGAVLRQSSGDADSYSLSQPAELINTFWSHSWRGYTRHKILTLYFVYNNNIAAISSLIACIVVGILIQCDVVEGKLCFQSECASDEDCDADSIFIWGIHKVSKSCMTKDFLDGTMPFGYWPLFAGGFAYLAALVLWQPRDLVFLDKVCIHQTDTAKKQRGIDGLGGFLRSSREIMLLWDATYFTRLWCTFELAAFTYLHGPQARIRVFPSLRGYVIIMGTIGVFAFEAVQILSEGLLPSAAGPSSTD